MVFISEVTKLPVTSQLLEQHVCVAHADNLVESRTHGSNWWKGNNHFVNKQRSTAVNILRVIATCFPFDAPA